MPVVSPRAWARILAFNDNLRAARENYNDDLDDEAEELDLNADNDNDGPLSDSSEDEAAFTTARRTGPNLLRFWIEDLPEETIPDEGKVSPLP